MFFDPSRVSFMKDLEHEARALCAELSASEKFLEQAPSEQGTVVPLLAGGQVAALAEARACLPLTTAAIEAIPGCCGARLRWIEPKGKLPPRREAGVFCRAVVLLSEGPAVLLVAGESRRIFGGGHLLMNPDSVHEVRNIAQGPLWLLEVDLREEALEQPLEELLETRSWSAWLREPIQFARYLFSLA